VQYGFIIDPAGISAFRGRLSPNTCDITQRYLSPRSHGIRELRWNSDAPSGKELDNGPFGKIYSGPAREMYRFTSSRVPEMPKELAQIVRDHFRK